MADAAREAEEATWHSMQELRRNHACDEDDLTGELVGELNSALRRNISGIQWSAKILRHRKGIAAEEKRYGADLLLHINYRDRSRSFSKGLLIQAKKCSRGERLTSTQLETFKKQCDKMLWHTPSSFVFCYSPNGLRVSSANKMESIADPAIFDNSEWTSFRFFYEFFRCPIGDREVTTTHIRGEPIQGLKSPDKVERDPIPFILDIDAIGVD